MAKLNSIPRICVSLNQISVGFSPRFVVVEILAIFTTSETHYQHLILRYIIVTPNLSLVDDRPLQKDSAFFCPMHLQSSLRLVFACIILIFAYRFPFELHKQAPLIFFYFNKQLELLFFLKDHITKLCIVMFYQY